MHFLFTPVQDIYLLSLQFTESNLFSNEFLLMIEL